MVEFLCLQIERTLCEVLKKSEQKKRYRKANSMKLTNKKLTN